MFLEMSDIYFCIVCFRSALMFLMERFCPVPGFLSELEFLGSSYSKLQFLCLAGEFHVNI